MPYVGNATATTFSTIPSVQRFNGDGSDTTFTLSQTVSSVQDILVSVDGVVQDSNAYTVPDGTTLTFSALVLNIPPCLKLPLFASGTVTPVSIVPR